ncbi:30594_t:CDS:2, partial [Gigaspora margarita]
EFNAGMSSTQRVESINAVIHKYVNSHLTLMECFNGIQSMLSFELQKAEYRDYLENLPFTIGSSSAIRIFSDIIELLKSSLTDEIFRIQKAQMDICFEYFSRLIPSNQYETCNKINDSNISNCLEDSTDKCQIALNSVINRVGLYKKNVNMDKINIIYDSVGIYDSATNRQAKNLALTSI